MKIKITLLGLLGFLAISVSGQNNVDLFYRLQAITNHGIDFFNVDGIEITSQKIDCEFSPRNIRKKFKQLSINENELNFSDSLLDFKNFYVFKSAEEPAGLINNISYYFIESKDSKTIGLTFAMVNKTDRDFEREFVRLIYQEAIPETVYNSLEVDSINFAGRKIPVGSSCQWMGINNLQCPSYGQMNWSVHKDADDAAKTVKNQFFAIKSMKKGKIVTDTTVNVTFEGTATSARRVIYDFTGVTSALVGMSGGKTLTIYFVAAPVRGHYVSCVMSFWNNDQINPGGLPPLMEQVMKLN
ncbi:MAG: hypothetical protein AB9834_23235 [Lentimicrobium sp.]